MTDAAILISSISPPNSGNNSGGYTPDQAFDLHGIRDRLDRALVLTAGLELKAETDRSALVAGVSFGIRAEAHCRKEAGLFVNLLSATHPE
ncbi:MAG: hypothetical protein ACRD51_03780 [Candidatus Acidiferrum sp.]